MALKCLRHHENSQAIIQNKTAAAEQKEAIRAKEWNSKTCSTSFRGGLDHILTCKFTIFLITFAQHQRADAFITGKIGFMYDTRAETFRILLTHKLCIQRMIQDENTAIIQRLANFLVHAFRALETQSFKVATYSCIHPLDFPSEPFQCSRFLRIVLSAIYPSLGGEGLKVRTDKVASSSSVSITSTRFTGIILTTAIPRMQGWLFEWTMTETYIFW